MATGEDFISRIMPSFGGGGFIDLVISMVVGAVGLGIVAALAFWFFKHRKKWNMKVEFRLPRNIQRAEDEEGNEIVKGVIRREWGKGYYNAKQGVVYVKRPKLKPVPMKPFNVKEFLDDSKILTVIQVGAEDYRPVLEDSYLEVEDYDTGESAALLKAKIDTSESKAWRSSYERERNATYTIGGWLKEHGQLLGFGFILFTIFVGFAIVYSKIA